MSPDLQIGLSVYLFGFTLTLGWTLRLLGHSRKSVSVPLYAYVAVIVYALAWPLSVPARLLEDSDDSPRNPPE